MYVVQFGFSARENPISHLRYLKSEMIRALHVLFQYDRKSYCTRYLVNSENIHVGRPIADWQKIVFDTLGSWNQKWCLLFQCCCERERKSCCTSYLVNSENIHVGRPIADWQKIEFSTVMCWIQKQFMLFNLVSVREKIVFYTLGSWNQKWCPLFQCCCERERKSCCTRYLVNSENIHVGRPIADWQKIEFSTLGSWNQKWCPWFLCCYERQRKSYFTPLVVEIRNDAFDFCVVMNERENPILHIR